MSPTVYRCDACGRFTRELVDVWSNGPTPEIDAGICRSCHEKKTR